MSTQLPDDGIKIPQLPVTTVSDPQLRPVIDGIRNIFNTRAFGKSEVDRWVTWRDLVENNIVVYKSGNTVFTGGSTGNFLPIGEDANDFSAPPQPTGFVVSGAFNNIILDWTDPNTLYSNHSFTEIWRSATSNRDDAVLLGTATGSVYTDPVANSSTYYYWIRFVSKKDVRGPFNTILGTEGQTALDPEYALEVLTGQITETQLYATLGARINLIDAPSTTPNSVAARVQAEASIRAQAILDEAAARQTADGALQTQINTLSAASSGDFQDLIAAVQEEQTARIAGDAAEAASRETLATQVRGTYTGTDINLLTTGLLYSERQARSTQDTAIASSVTALSSTVNSNYTTLNSAITSEATTRATADTTLTTNLNALSSTVSGNYSTLNSAITSEATTRASADTTLTNSVNSLSSTVTTNYNTLNAAITSEASTRASADSSLSSQISTVSAAATKTRTYLQTTAPTTGMITGDLWFDSDDNNKSYRYSGTAWVASDDLRIASNVAAIQTETTARTTADTALASQITTVQAVADAKNRVYRQASTPTGTLVSGDLWFDSDDNNRPYRYNGSSWELTEDPRIPSNAVAIQTETTARVNADNSLFAQYTVKIDTNGYVSGFGLASTATNAAPFSDFIIRADRFSVASPSGPGITPIVPFVVNTTTQTVNGVSVPAGVYMDAAYIKNGTITGAKIGNAAIDTAKIADAAIVSAKIADATITAAKIQDATITSAKIGLGTITAANILDAAITGAKIANATITTANIQDAAITTAKIGNAQITGAKIANATIGSALIANAAIVSGLIADAAIIEAKIADAAIGSAKIQDAAITNAKIGNAAISSAKIGDLEVGTLKIAGNAVSYGGAIVSGGTVGFYTPVGGTLAVIAYSGGALYDWVRLNIYADGGNIGDFPPGAPVIRNAGGDAGNDYVEAYGPSSGVASVYLGPGSHSVGFEQSYQAYNAARIIWIFFQR